MTAGDVTRLLEAAGSGDCDAFDALYRAVYDELHRMAQAKVVFDGGCPAQDDGTCGHYESRRESMPQRLRIDVYRSG